ncbi:DNA-binding LacI/PurR family transcriptional regulator [Microbacterium testaceum]|uniref:LacI family DNA-binding transcriptional regulator n=1 Tax=Microbacterium testaceum TaxID=2033 RepID=UPI002789E8F0|nr:substrate-binding domain-containing protein [Microbacterium testaceum]MDQ1115883.1 DNA-binding LacI/PurR family transcriptional regulator [Microbacterium testaceum]
MHTDTFTEDDEAGAHLATTHLLSHGHRRIAYIGDMVHLSTETKRVEGWRRALRDAGVDVDERLVASGVSDRESAASALERLRGIDDPPTALFSANARSSMALAHVLRGRPMPYVGFGDFPMADTLTPSVTVIDQDPRRIGALAAERVFARLQPEPGVDLDEVTVIDVSLVERESCGL